MNDTLSSGSFNFAEVFANSELGKLNAMGRAMSVSLKRRGYYE